MTTSRPALQVLSLAATAVVLSACQADPKVPRYRLEGSLGQVMDLGYDEARILIAPEDVSLVFVRIHPLNDVTPSDGGTEMSPTGTSEDYPLKLAYRLLEDGLPSGGRVDLAAVDQNGAQRGVLSRLVQNDPRNTFPPIVRGTLAFDRPLDPDTVVNGDFHVTFENGVEVASGRTVFAKYSARVQP
ncbi:MAG: hypothetical protein ACOZQL_33385 [Myxococcota bacterium]